MLTACGSEDYPIVASGIDWITCTAKNSELSLQLDTLGMRELHAQETGGAQVSPSTRLGYKGYKADHLFFGRRDHDVMLQCSGELADTMFPEVVPLASNVSRLDVQVTVWTEGNEVKLAEETCAALERAPHSAGRPRTYDLIVNYPAGQTLQINQRSSDNFGRIYDKGIEAKLCGPGLLWRYEVELKGDISRHASQELLRQEQLQEAATALVHRWYSARSVLPPWTPLTASGSGAKLSPRDRAPVLTWFDQTVSVTIAKAIHRHGLNEVLKALHLLDHVTPKEKYV